MGHFIDLGTINNQLINSKSPTGGITNKKSYSKGNCI